MTHSAGPHHYISSTVNPSTLSTYGLNGTNTIMKCVKYDFVFFFLILVPVRFLFFVILDFF